jgi:hypothetical protein
LAAPFAFNPSVVKLLLGESDDQEQKADRAGSSAIDEHSGDIPTGRITHDSLPDLW